MMMLRWFAAAALFMGCFGLELALAAPNITYHGRLIKPNGRPVEGSAVSFRIQVRSPLPSNCVLFEEEQTKDLRGSGGIFSISLNDGNNTLVDPPVFSLDRVFQNVGRFEYPVGQSRCAFGSDYSPTVIDGRVLQVWFREPGMPGWEALPGQTISYVPMAIESISVGGFKAQNLFRVESAPGIPHGLSPWSVENYNKLLGLINNVNVDGGGSVTGVNVPSTGFSGSLSGDVTGGQSSTSVVRIQGRAVDANAPLSGQVLTWNAGASRWEPANVPVAGNPDWADITGKPTTFAPGGTASGDLSGTYPNPTIAANAVSGGKIADGGVGFSKIAAGSASGQVLLYNGTSWSASKLNFNDLVNNSGVSPWPGACGPGQYVTWVSAVDGFQCVNLPATDWADITNKPTTVAVNTISSGAGLYLTYEPNGAACTPGQVLKWNNNRWECGADNDSATGVTSVGVSVPAYMTSTGGPVTSTGTIALGFGSQAQNRVFAGPSSGSGAPSFRELSILDIRADSAGSPAFWDISGPCAAGEMPTYSSALDQVSCQPYSITSAQVTSALGYTPLQSSDLSGYVPTSRTVSAGTGLSGGGDLSANRTLSIAAGGVGTTELASNAVTTVKIADGQVTDAKIVGMSADKLTSGAGLYLTYQPDGSACTPGQVLKWNNSRWECGADNDSATAETDPTVEAYAKQAPSADFTTPGDVLTIANSAITTAKINDGAVTTAKIADSQVTTAKIADSQVTTAKIGDSQVTNAKIVGMSADKLTSGAGLYLTYQPDGSACTPGQVLKWNNSRWECGADNDSATAETDPTVEAFAKQAPNSSDFSVTGNELTLNTVPIAKGGTGATSRADAINNLLPDQNLENGKILQTDGTNVSWVPAPATGVTSVDVSVPAYMTSTGGAITSSGTIALGFASQAQNSVFAGPTSGSGAPAFRSLFIADIKANSAGNPAFWNISGACAAGEMPTHSSVTDQVTCEPYAITSSQVTTALGYTPLQSSDLSGYVPTSRTVTAGTGLTGGGDLSADRSFAVNVGTGANQIPQLDGSGKLAGSVIPDLSWSQITSGTPTTLAGYGITNAVTNAGNTPSIQAGLDGAKPTAGTAGRLYVSTDTQQIYRDDGSDWVLVGSSGGGTVTNIATGTGLTGGPITETGTISIATGGVSSTELASNAVTTDKVTDSAITADKLATDSVTTAKIADGQVTNAKIAGMSADKLTSGAGLYLTYQPDGTACTPGQVLKWNNSRWECADDDNAGGVVGVTGSAPINVTGTATNPVIGVNDASTGAKGVVQLATSSDTAGGLAVQANDTRLTNARAPSGAAGGDLGGTYPNPTVNQIRGNPVSSTTLAVGDASKILRWSGTQFEAGYVNINDLKKSDGSPQFTSATCAAYQTLTWSSLTDTFVCANIGGLDGGAISVGTVAPANLGTGTPDSTKFLRGDGTWVAVSGTGQWDSGLNDTIHFEGNGVGIGQTAGAARLTVRGDDPIPGVPFPQSANFAANGSWTVPDGVSEVTVELWGGGGGGGGATVNANGGSGGAGGQYVQKVISVTPGQVLNVIVGLGGTGTTGNGGTGGDSNFGSGLAVAKGGAGGAANRGAAGLGSTAGGVGDIIRAGGNGAVGTTTASGGGGGGAGTTQDGGAASGTTGGVGGTADGGNGGAGRTTSGVGTAGTGFGAGGSGGFRTTTTSRAGGAGSAGYVRLSWMQTPLTYLDIMALNDRTGATQVVVAANGNVGIGTTTPADKLHVAGNIRATAYTSTSDRRLKRNIATVDGLEKILQLRGVSFDWRDTGKHEIGLIAQEVEEVFPDLVVTDPKSGIKAVKYSSLVSPLIESTKDLYGMCRAQADQLNRLQAENVELKAQNLELKRRLEAIERHLGIAP